MTIYSKSQTVIEGLDELIEAFTAVGEKAKPVIRKAVDVASIEVLAKVKSKAPVLTGTLKANLKMGKATVSKKYPFRVNGKVTFSSKGSHAVPVELGHRIVINGKQVGTVKEKPFMRPAADESEPYVIKTIVDAMNKALDEFGGVK